MNLGDSTATIDRVVVEGNTAGGPGGGLSIINGSTTAQIVDSTIQNNVSEDADSGDGYGGGIYFGGARALIERSTVAWNRSGDATATSAYGGGLYLSDSSVTLRNSTVSGNVVEAGSAIGKAIHLNGGGTGFSTLLIEQSTIVRGPAGSVQDTALGITENGQVTFGGSIVEGGCDYWTNGTFSSYGYNVEHPLDGSLTTQCGLTNPSDVLTSNPLLKPLAGYGGPTETHALLAGAPAIWLVASGSCQTTDQRSAPRAFLFCDAGSYESGAQPPGMWIFSDGVESGGTTAWSTAVP